MKLLKGYAILICRTSRTIFKSKNNIIKNYRFQNIKKGELRLLKDQDLVLIESFIQS